MIPNKPEHILTFTEVEVTPEERAQNLARLEEFRKNVDWFSANAAALRAAHTGKFICIAGEEVFVGDNPVEVVDRAKAAHPDLAGGFLSMRLLPREMRMSFKLLGDMRTT